MPQPDSSSWFSDGWKVAQALGSSFMLVLAWLGNRVISRVESLERTSMTHAEFTQVFTELREDRKQMHAENQAALRRIENKLDADEPSVMASRLGRAERDIEELRTWKHQVDPFITRRVDP